MATVAQRQPAPPFRDVLEEGAVGTQPVAVKRGLWRAGHRFGWDSLDGVSIAARVLGETAVTNLRDFQEDSGLRPDGVYGARTHRKLVAHFDNYAVALYTKPPPGLQLPRTFRPTHQTEGLPGFPAVDVFGDAGVLVLSPDAGKVTKLSGHDPAQGGRPGGPYGLSVYLSTSRGTAYMTHFGSRAVALNAVVAAGQVLGTVCDAAVAGMDTDLSHIHLGFKPAT